MLFLLRQLRRLELRKRSGRYFLYAIGEIALIVVGILIAVQINQWNERRVERKLERQYLVQLHEEFTQIADEAPDFVERAELTVDYCDVLVDVASNPDRAVTHPALFLAAMEYSFRFWQSDVARDTYQELLSTGSMRLLRNPNLKEALTRFYREVDEHNTFVVQFRSRVEPYHSRFAEVIPLEQGLWRFENTNGREPFSEINTLKIDPLWAKGTAARLLAKGELTSFLPHIMSMQNAMLRWHRERFEQAEILLELLEAELS